MRFSLDLLLERSALRKSEYKIIKTSEEMRFTDIRLYGRQKEMNPDYLYMDLSRAGICLSDGTMLLTFVNCEKDFCIETFSKLQETFAELRRMINCFGDSVIRRDPLQKIIELFYDFLGNPAYIVDSSFKVLAIDKRNDMRSLSAKWKRLEDDGYLSYEIVEGLIESEELGLIEGNQETSIINSSFFYVPFINFNMKKNNRLIGHLFVAGMLRKITDSDVELVSLLGPMVVQAVTGNSRFQNERGKYYEYFLTDIMSGKLRDRTEITKQMIRINYHPENRHITAMILAETKKELQHERILNSLERFRGCKPIHYKNGIALIIPMKADEREEDILTALNQMGDKLHFYGGVSDCFYGFDRIFVSAKQAEAALFMCKSEANTMKPSADGLKRNILSFHECALYEIFDENRDYGYIFPAQLSVLREYDAQNDGKLMETLKVYLSNERNVIETAAGLYIHRNTLTYRIRKIQELSGLNLSDPVMRLRILLALHVEANRC